MTLHISRITSEGIITLIAIFLFFFCIFLIAYRKNLHFLALYKCLCFAFGMDVMIFTAIQSWLNVVWVYPLEGKLYPYSSMMTIITVILGGALLAIIEAFEEKDPSLEKFIRK